MSKRLLTILALAASLGFAPSLIADHGDKGKQHGKKHDDDQGWERRDGYEYRVYGDHDGRPPGWTQGKKTGWKNCGMSPGQAKKYGCQSYVYQERPYYYYHDDLGRIVIRRPVIEVRGSVVVR